jgi:hypothetical protein
MRNTKAIGDATVAMVLARLALKGKTVLTPYGDKDRFDLVLYEDEKFSRIQCKTGRLKKGTVRFPTRSAYSHAKGKSVIRTYEGQIEFYGVYCPETDGVYLVPVSEAKTRSIRHLPLEKAKEFEV